MSFNIPIVFDDCPFFDWGDKRWPQHKRNQQRSGRRQPSVFGQWEEPEFFYDYPTRKQHYRPNYGQRQRQYERESEQNRFDEGAQKDIYDTEEHEETPRGIFGYDGWDIPVQHMDRRSHKHHKHKQMPKQKTKVSKAHDISNDNDEPKQPQREVNKSSKTNEASSNTESKTGHSNEAMKVKTEKQSKVFPDTENMEQQTSKTKPLSQATEDSSQTTEDSSQTNEAENNESTEIPIAYSPSKNPHKRLSRRLSQCDPPSPADIKLARIKSIVQKTEGIEERIEEFEDPAQNKNYLYISETLMKTLLDLDTVDSEGLDIVRKARKEGVKTVQALVDKLEAKLEENKSKS
jgi:hypothetical protein